MKYIRIHIFSIALAFLSCTNTTECKLKILDVLNPVSLGTWENVTNLEIDKSADGRLLFLKKLETKKGISIFDRKFFFDYLLSKNNSLNFDYFAKLFIVEINNSGEVSTKDKYLILLCRDSTQIIKFSSIIGKWSMIDRHFEESKKVLNNINNINSIINLPRKSNNLDGILSISEFLANGHVKVKVFGALDEVQWKNLKFLKATKD